jgi:hypothetical protein
MDAPLPDSATPRPDPACGPAQNAMNGVRRSIPAWNREHLVSLFQLIDGSTRIEAERQIAEFEQSFRSGAGGDVARAGDPRSNVK